MYTSVNYLNCASYVYETTDVCSQASYFTNMSNKHGRTGMENRITSIYTLFPMYTSILKQIPSIMLVSICYMHSQVSCLGNSSDRADVQYKKEINTIRHYYVRYVSLYVSHVIYIRRDYISTCLLTRFIRTPGISLPIIHCVIQEM